MWSWSAAARWARGWRPSRTRAGFGRLCWKSELFLPQRRTEELLASHLAELGVPVLREHTVTGLRQDAGGVGLDVVTPDGTTSLRAAYVVGCDGASSVVRKAAGIGWAGEPSTWTTILGDTEPARRLDLHGGPGRRQVADRAGRPRDARGPGQEASDLQRPAGEHAPP